MATIDEGYIKFKCIHQPANNIEIPGQLIRVRDELHRMKLIGYYPDLQVGYGNISIKVPGGIIISATQTGNIYPASPVDFTLVTRYNIDENTVWCAGSKPASSETMTHAALYEVDAEIRAVIHIHNKQLWDKYLHRFPTTDEAIPYGTPQMAKAIAFLYRENPKVKQYKTIVMGGHEEGIICFGGSLSEALAVTKKLTEHKFD